MAFDNGHRRRWSRIVEVDPGTGEIVWSYKGNDKQPFFSRTRGIVNELSNGNVFTVSSNSARIFEMNRDKKIVWEYWSPEKFDGKVVPIRGMPIEGELAETVTRLMAEQSDPPVDTVPAGEPEVAAEEDTDGAEGDTDGS